MTLLLQILAVLFISVFTGMAIALLIMLLIWLVEVWVLKPIYHTPIVGACPELIYQDNQGTKVEVLTYGFLTVSYREVNTGTTHHDVPTETFEQDFTPVT